MMSSTTAFILKAVELAQDQYARYVKEMGTYLER